MEINKYLQKQLQILFLVEYMILPINDQSKSNYKVCKIAY